MFTTIAFFGFFIFGCIVGLIIGTALSGDKWLEGYRAAIAEEKQDRFIQAVSARRMSAEWQKKHLSQTKPQQ